MKLKFTAATLLCCLLLTGCQVRISTGNTTGGGTNDLPITTVGGDNQHTTTDKPSTDRPTTHLPSTTPPETQGFDPNPNAPQGEELKGLIPESEVANPSWFDDAAFIGDSVSLKLRTHCLTGALGKAQFFAVGSYSTVNALRPVSDGGPHPSYRGKVMTSEECIQLSGAKKVFIMLGMNDLSYGIDATIDRYQTLVERILEKSPNAKIFIQSMTPMTATSTIINEKRNNTNVKLYNQRLLKMCEERGWYFVDVASVMYDDQGANLRTEYCSDPVDMGVHFTQAGCERWVEYLLTHTVHF